MFKRFSIIGLLLCALALPAWAGTIDAVQGLYGATLVAGKSTTLRVYLNDPSANVDRADVVMVMPDGVRKQLVFTPWDTMRIVGTGADASVAVTLTGPVVSLVGEYFFQVKLNYLGQLVQSEVLDRVQLLPTKDLRIGVDLAWSGFAPKAGEIEAAGPLLKRMGELLPVRDGIAKLDENQTSGIRWTMQAAPRPLDPQTCEFFVPLSTKAQGDHIDRGLAYRYGNEGEANGGFGARYCGSFIWASAVATWDHLPYTATHEFGHTFGLGHEGWLLPELEWRHGYDVGNNNLWPIQVTSVMYGYPFNYAFRTDHWETIRQKLVQLDSTGPTGAVWNWRQVQDPASQHVAVIPQADGRRLLFTLDANGALFLKRETAPRNDTWGAVESLGGTALMGRITPVAEADGRVTVFVRGSDQHVYYRAQTTQNGSWGGWQQLTVRPVSGFTMARHADGRLAAFMIEDGALIVASQAAAGLGFTAPVALGGWGLSGVVAADSYADGRLQVFVVGGNGDLYGQTQTIANGSSWSGWLYFGDPSTQQIHELQMARTGDGKLAVFMLKGQSRSIAYRMENAPNGGWGAPTELPGLNLRNGFRAVRVWDGRLAVYAVGSDMHIYTLFQADLARPTVWSNWVDTNHQGLRIDVSSVTTSPVALDIFSADVNGAISQGVTPRP